MRRWNTLMAVMKVLAHRGEQGEILLCGRNRLLLSELLALLVRLLFDKTTRKRAPRQARRLRRAQLRSRHVTCWQQAVADGRGRPEVTSVPSRDSKQSWRV